VSVAHKVRTIVNLIARRTSVSVRIAVLDDYQRVAREYADWTVLPASAEVEVFHEHISDHDDLVRRLTPFDVIAVMRERTPFPRALLERLPKLRLLITTGMRNASIDMGAARELGITVCGTSGGFPTGTSVPTAELTWGLILAVARNLPHEDRTIREGGWQHTVGTELYGRTLGIVGLGRLGARVSEIGRAFGMEVVAWSQNLTEQAARDVGVRKVGKDELFRISDFVTIHLVLSERTRGLVGAAELAAMKRTAYLINTSRGPIVDENALLAVLRQGRIAGAGLDVFAREPLPPDDALRSAPRTVLTPHIGYVAERTYRAFYADTVESLTSYLDGQPVRVLNG
jgi:phosphoglycerate dehydrogenase-like enzyme